VALRVGRATFKTGLKEYGSMLGLTEMAFRLLPLSTKLQSGATAFAELFNKYTDQKVRIEEKSNRILWSCSGAFTGIPVLVEWWENVQCRRDILHCTRRFHLHHYHRSNTALIYNRSSC
jgi:hypothetical protein